MAPRSSLTIEPRRSLALLLLLLLHPSPAAAQPPRPRTPDWLVECGHGAFTHFLSDNRDANISSPAAWNALVDAFNVSALAAQLASAGVCYHILTLGQNSGYYVAPNPTLDALVGRDASTSRCSRRNLITDLAAAYAPYGIRLGVYVPSGAPNRDPEAVAALNWTDSFPESVGGYNVSTGSWGTAGLDEWGVPWGFNTGEEDPSRQVLFQNKWNAVLTDWAASFGAGVHAWWVDGMYWPTQMYDFDDAPNFQSLGAALRAGNPDALVAFNPGQIVSVPIESCEQDFTAGETAANFPTPGPRRTGPCGVQRHLLSYLGPNWGARHSVPRYTADEAREMTSTYVSAQWALTWDAPIEDSGLVEAPYAALFAALSNITGAPIRRGRGGTGNVGRGA